MTLSTVLFYHFAGFFFYFFTALSHMRIQNIAMERTRSREARQVSKYQISLHRKDLLLSVIWPYIVFRDIKKAIGSLKM